MMKVCVNGEYVETNTRLLEELLLELDYSGAWLATAVNSEVVPADMRASCVLNEGDKIEILSPMQGG